MKRKSLLRRFLVAGAIVGLAVPAAVIGQPAPGYADGDEVPGRYIVVVKRGVRVDDVARDHGLAVEQRYGTIQGVSARGAPGKLAQLRGDPRVGLAEADRIVTLSPPVGGFKVATDGFDGGADGFDGGADGQGKGNGKAGPAQPPQSVPTGINRIDADKSATAGINGSDERVNVDVAIIDTGIQTDHPDLNVVGGKNCADGKSYADKNGHGTHVAGTAAAKDNTIGVVGVAPGARLWAVRVLNANGSGFISWIICGVDWVTANTGTIDVANMSLGVSGGSDALDLAVANSVAAGVTYAVSAGNSSNDASNQSPARVPDVLTVSAIADSDGRCGGLGPATSYGADDTFATFSSFGSVVDLAAPGVNILSTYKGSAYATGSGTSMSSPHVAGAAALVKANNPGASPADVRNALMAGAVAQAAACDASLNDGNGGFTGDPDTSPEPLVYAAGL
ncbi:MAG: S8 family peptidase [Chloroflexi bacterium]|nr:S8 family peptidase [Chloroflexota bacterium]